MGTYRGLFGSTPTYGTPPFAPVPGAPDDPGSVPTAPAPDKHAGLKRAAGIFADFAAGLTGREGPYLAMQEQRRRETEQQAYQQRQLSNEYAMYDYKLAHPAPVNNDTINDFNWYKGLSPDDQALYHQMHPQFITTDNGDGTKTIVPIGVNGPMTGSAAGPPAAAIAALKANPALKDQFEQKYGAGSAGSVLGGGSTPGTPPFSVSRSRLDAITAGSESGGRDYTAGGVPMRSPAGALYGMQVLPSTAHNPGFGIAPVRDESAAEYDRVGKEYRAAMQQHYGGDPAKMWAAYHAGPGNVDKALQYGSGWLGHLGPKTQQYVAKNTRALRGN